MKITDKMLNEFLYIMEDWNEFVFGTKEQIRSQLKMCLETQGYWSANYIRVYYDKTKKQFYIENRF